MPAKLFVSAFILMFCIGHGAASATPRGCARGVVANATVVGVWATRLKDDESENWESAGVNEFRADGSFFQSGVRAGNWCMVGDVLLFSFDEPPETVYRGTVNGDVITGTQSWGGAGTGILKRAASARISPASRGRRQRRQPERR